MIILCELSFIGRAHVPFNAGLLATIHAAFPKEDLGFYGSSTHIEELKQQLEDSLRSCISWKEILPPSPGSVYLKRYLSELKILRCLIRDLPRDSTSRVLLTSAYPSTILALKIARLLYWKDLPAQIVLHGLSGVVGKRYRHPIRRFQDMKTALTLFWNENIQYLVLEEPIRKTVLQSLPFLSGKVETFEHPVSPFEGGIQAVDLSEPICFGFLGLADRPKGFPVFNELASHVTAKYGRRVEFHAIGHLPSNGAPVCASEALSTKPGTALMSRDKFLNAVQTLHFIVLPHEAQSYQLTASGVLLDAITWGKPVIARKIPIFENLFEKHGDIGYLFGDDTELDKIVGQIVQAGDKSRYHRQILNLRGVRKSRAPETLASAYRDISRKSGK
jgi:hypothetical protein